MPEVEGRFTSDIATEHMEAQFENATPALIGGLINVVTIGCEIAASPASSTSSSQPIHASDHKRLPRFR